jgi:para-nitrobenzyl esterase
MASASEVIDELRKQSGDGPMMGKFGWSPTADGEVITANDARDFSAKTPLLVGYTRNELAARPFDPSLDTLTADDAKARIERMYPGGKGAALMAEYQRQYPESTPQFLYSVVASMMFVGGALDQMEDRAAQKDATPAYAYRFDWCPDIYDGRLLAFHSLEIGFAFDNTDRWDSATGGGERAQALASLMSEAWINFARSGNPNHRELTAWPAYDSAGKSIMIFDDVCRVAKGPDEGAHRILRSK